MPQLGEVFISYSWDSEQHIAAVLSLSNRLRSDGIDCALDQYEVSPPEGWPRWMERKVASASLVLVVCTETYLKRVMGLEVAGVGNGVRWEGNLIYQHLYNQGAHNTRFIPVLMREADSAFIPTPLQGASHFNVDTDAGYGRLLGRLLGRPTAERPALGERQPKPAKEVRTDFSGFIDSPINIGLWDAAKWRAVAFGDTPHNVPILGLAFLNKGPATDIFRGWRHRFGESDDFDELRISIIEGDIPGEHAGYSIQLGINFERAFERYRQAGLTFPSDMMLATVNRIHRMNPSPSSQYLANFKDSYRVHGEFLLVPATCNPDGSDLQILSGLAIRKRLIYFRQVEEVGPNDIDSAVLDTGSVERNATGYSGSVP